MKKIKIGNRLVGEGERCFIIAEAGSNHDGKLEQAKQLIDIAADAKADAVKFQTFFADKIVAKTKDRASYLNKLVSKDKTMHDIFKKLELPREWLKELYEYAESRGLIFLSTPFDEEAVDLLDEIGAKAFKVASFEIVHLPLLRHIAKKKKSIILSTGMASLSDIEEALETIYSEGNNQVIVLHCGVNYPLSFEDVNLRAMVTIKHAFQIPVGYSDHTMGITVPIAAISLGASMIEKHFTISRNLSGPDHPFALELGEFKAMVQEIRNAEKSLGSPIKKRTKSEEEMYKLGRRSIFAVKDIAKGEEVKRETLAILRPGIGLHPRFLEEIIGTIAKVDIKANTPITWDKI